MVWRNVRGICERKTLFRMKKEVNRAEFKGTRTGLDREQNGPNTFSFCTLVGENADERTRLDGGLD